MSVPRGLAWSCRALPGVRSNQVASDERGRAVQSSSAIHWRQAPPALVSNLTRVTLPSSFQLVRSKKAPKPPSCTAQHALRHHTPSLERHQATICYCPSCPRTLPRQAQCAESQVSPAHAPDCTSHYNIEDRAPFHFASAHSQRSLHTQSMYQAVS
jgi:hypothetical protein